MEIPHQSAMAQMQGGYCQAVYTVYMTRLVGMRPSTYLTKMTEEHLDLQPESAGPTSSSDTGPNATEGESLDKEAGESVDEFSSQNNSTEFLRSPQCDTCATTIPMSVREWMGKAIIADTCRESSRDDRDSYLQIAVDLALVLTKHLLELLGTKFDLKIDEISSDNLTILVKPEPLALSQLANQPWPEITGVRMCFLSCQFRATPTHMLVKTSLLTHTKPAQDWAIYFSKSSQKESLFQ